MNDIRNSTESLPPTANVFRDMTTRIVLCFPVEDHHVDQLAAVSDNIEVVNAGQKSIAEEIHSADVFFGHAKVPIAWEDVVSAGRLKWIQSSAAGLDHCLKPSVINSDIIVTSVSGLFANQVAETTMALMFGVIRSLPTFFNAYKIREFVRRPTMDFHGKTVGIIGFGGNGRRIAEVLAPFGNRILATDMFPWDKPDHVDELLPEDQLESVLSRSDIAILCMPLNDQTHHMIDAKMLAAMPVGSIVINVARGPVMNEDDLIAALESGHIVGAGLDVAEIEPLPATSPLWNLPNVLITPHIGAQSAYRVSDTIDFGCENIRRYLSGQELINVVDKKLGFPTRHKLNNGV